MSLVTYDTYVELVFSLTRMDKINKEKARSNVNSIVDGSSTNLSGGLIKGEECSEPRPWNLRIYGMYGTYSSLPKNETKTPSALSQKKHHQL